MGAWKLGKVLAHRFVAELERSAERALALDGSANAIVDRYRQARCARRR